jgi:Flp pilus assembly protein TadG
MASIATEGQIRDDTSVTDVRRCVREQGQATVEFALVIPLLLLLVVGLFEFGKTFNYWISLDHLANEGARWAAVDKVPTMTTPPSGNDIKNYVRSQILTDELKNKVGPNGITLCFDGASATQPKVGDAVTVSLTAPNPISAPFLDSALNITIRGKATMRLEQAPAAGQLAGWEKCPPTP